MPDPPKGGTTMDARKRTRAWLVASMLAGGIGLATPAHADDEVDRVLAESGRTHYEKFCTSCHGQGGAPGSKAKSDLRTYVSRHGGKFPAADWIAIVTETRPASVHADVWETMRRSQEGTNAEPAARGMVGQIARYVMSIQAK
jgi:hypothetical protein